MFPLSSTSDPGTGPPAQSEEGATRAVDTGLHQAAEVLARGFGQIRPGVRAVTEIQVVRPAIEVARKGVVRSHTVSNRMHGVTVP